MSWAEIKKSVNSTLGTSNFKPLDEIIVEEVNNFKEGLKNGSLVPQKSERLENDWIDLSLSVLNASDSYMTYVTSKRLETGVYIATVGASISSGSVASFPRFAFLLNIDRDNANGTYATIGNIGAWTFSLKYVPNYDRVYDEISPQSYSFGSSNHMCYLDDFKVKRIL